MNSLICRKLSYNNVNYNDKERKKKENPGTRYVLRGNMQFYASILQYYNRGRHKPQYVYVLGQ